ncbi:MAG: tRNA 2-thiouridine(34) synthase MnmA [Candidatus Caldatribacteriota bacterium]
MAMKNNPGKRVIVALSGGIDSTVATILLKEKGYTVGGITFFSNQLGNRDNLRIAEKIAQDLQIPWQPLDLTQEFQEIVVEYFCQAYLSGRTPNPCVICNWKIKFGLLLEKIKSWGADYLATGHYVNKEYLAKNKEFILKKGLDKNKDQSYFLYRLNQSVLSKVLFPLGKLTKDQVRLIAKRFNLINQYRKESQEICFISDDNYKEFLVQYIKKKIKRGKFIDREGKLLGEHQGLPFYTIGQRRGLGISANNRKYVLKIDDQRNEIVLGEEKYLYQNKMLVSELNFISGVVPTQPLKVEVKIRYNGQGSPAMIYPSNQDGKKRILVVFDQPQRAITPGQSAVFYQKDIVLGGGVIEKG